MKRRLLLLHFLKRFETTHRNSTFKKVTKELFLKPPAISYQIKSLENFLIFKPYYIDKQKDLLTINSSRHSNYISFTRYFEVA